jgi:hypothetical protein
MAAQAGGISEDFGAMWSEPTASRAHHADARLRLRGGPQWETRRRARRVGHSLNRSRARFPLSPPRAPQGAGPGALLHSPLGDSLPLGNEWETIMASCGNPWQHLSAGQGNTGR